MRLPATPGPLDPVRAVLAGWGIQLAGVGFSGFGFLDNSHSKDAPGHSLGVNVEGAVGSVAGEYSTTYEDGDIFLRKTVHDDGSVTHTKSEEIHRRSDGGAIGFISTTQTTPAPEFRNPSLTPDREVQTSAYHETFRRITHYQSGFDPVEDTYDAPERRYRRIYRAGGSEPGRFGPNERRNPHYTGGSTCNNISCIIGSDKPKGLTYKESKNHTTPGGLPPAPEEAAPARNGTAPLYTANDVLERYDPDSTSQTGGRSERNNTAGPGGFPEDPNG